MGVNSYKSISQKKHISHYIKVQMTK